MRKFIISIFVITTFMFCLTSHVKAQGWNDVRYADGLELLKMMDKFIGKWEWKASKDTTYLHVIAPSDNGPGYLSEYYRIVNGKTEIIGRGIIGQAGPKGDKLISWYKLTSEGGTYRDVLKFLSENKCVGNRYNLMHNSMYGSFELEFKPPDKFESVWVIKSVRSVEDRAKKGNVFHGTWIRVKE